MAYLVLTDGIVIKVSFYNFNIFFYFISQIANIGNNIPAPNAYKTKGLMGLNFNSKFRSGKLISMSQKFRYKDSRENYPGPGAYIRFSEFGILVSKNARQRKTGEETKNSKVSKTEANETSGNVETTKNETKNDTKQLQTE